MKSLYLKAGKTLDVFNDLKDNFSGTLQSYNDEYNLALDSDLAQGNIKGITFSEGMTYLQFDMLFSEDVRMSMELSNNSPIFFAYCSNGTLQHSYGVQGERIRLKQNYTGIFKSNTHINSILHFEKNIRIKFSVIGLQTKSSGIGKNAGLIKKLKNTFCNNNEDCVHIRLQNFKIAQAIQALETVTQKDIGRNLLKNHLLEKILEMEIEQYSDSFSLLLQSINSFILKRVEEIKRASNFIKKFPVELFTTKSFATQNGLWAHKLQEKFKLLSSRTANGFLVMLRIEKQRI